ncbi:MAG: hypothetical protein NUW37_13310 [Planctomycetes bacterium]|nr:hypothetical protein [Planctomycetota bacterium]
MTIATGESFIEIIHPQNRKVLNVAVEGFINFWAWRDSNPQDTNSNKPETQEYADSDGFKKVGGLYGGSDLAKLVRVWQNLPAYKRLAILELAGIGAFELDV